MELGDWSGFKKRRAEAKQAKESARHRALQLSGDHRRLSARARRRSRCLPHGRSTSWSARCPAARATKPPSRNASRNGSACRSTMFMSMRATPTSLRKAAARIPHARCACRHCHGQCVRRRDRERQADRRAYAGNRRRRYRLCRRPLHVKGTDRSVGIFHVARAAADGKSVPEDLRGPLDASLRRDHHMQLGFPTAPRLRGRDRPADRPCNRELHCDRRCRPRHQPDGC